MILLDRVTKNYGKSNKPALNRASIHVGAGEFVIIVGTSGAGKSTLLKLLTREEKPSSGKIVVGGIDYDNLKDKHIPLLRRKIGVVFQDFKLLPNRTVFENIAFALEIAGMTNREIRATVPKVIELVGLKGKEKQFPHQLSGGMSQRVMIAMAIACKPRLLIADEPTTALDVTIQAQIVDLLLELQQKECMSLILITHDLALVAEAAHRIIVMYAGQVVEEGRAEDIFREPKHPYTQALLRSLPEFAEGKSRLQSLPGVVPGKYDRPQGCLLNPRCPYATDLCRSVEPELRQVGNRQVKCHTPLNAQGEPSNV